MPLDILFEVWKLNLFRRWALCTEWALLDFWRAQSSRRVEPRSILKVSARYSIATLCCFHMEEGPFKCSWSSWLSVRYFWAIIYQSGLWPSLSCNWWQWSSCFCFLLTRIHDLGLLCKHTRCLLGIPHQMLHQLLQWKVRAIYLDFDDSLTRLQV
jgi:hypothetical protein